MQILPDRLLYPPDLMPPVSKEQCDRLLLWAVNEQRASDIDFISDDPVWIQVDGQWFLCTELALSMAELNFLVESFAGGAQQLGRIQGGKSVDFAYVLKVREGFIRFRVNVTNTNKGPHIVMRALPQDLPLLEKMMLEPQLLGALYPPNGLIVVSGVMGSGKSTFLAAVLRKAIIEKGRQVLTLEEPIEFDFTTIPYEQRSAPICQSGITQHITSWADGVRTMTRRKAEIVLVGEARDRETLEAMLGTVETGVTAYCTVHAMDVPQTVTRIVNVFDEQEKSAISATLKASLRLIIHQRLVPRIRTEQDIKAGVPGRIALREFLEFDEGVRRKLYRTAYGDLIPTIRDMVTKLGQPLVYDAEIKHKAGLISDETLEAIQHEQKSASETI